MLPPLTADQLQGMRQRDHDALELGIRTPEEAARFVPAEVCRELKVALTDPGMAALFDDKLRFARVIRGLGIPSPDLLAVHEGDAEDGGEILELLAERAPTGAVVKPSVGSKGQGVVVFERVQADGRSGMTMRGRRRPVLGALRHAKDKSEDGRVIVQQLLRQHEAMDGYAPQPLSTVRVITLLRRDGTARLLGAFLRLGRAGAMTDNTSRGGIAVAVEVESGALGGGIVDKPLRRMDQHPDGAEPFRARHLPHWDEVVALCVGAAPLFPGVKLVGWDVMITGQGPRLIEANWDVGLRTLQAVRGAGLLSQDLLDDFGELDVAQLVRPPVVPDDDPPWLANA